MTARSGPAAAAKGRAPERAGRARGPTRDVESSKDRIHAVAMQLFARYGYEGVSLQRIADEAGLHKSSLFHHYRGKLELAEEVFAGTVERLLERIRPLEADDPPDLEKLWVALDEAVELFSDDPPAARLLLSVLSAPRDSDLNIPIAPEEDHPLVEAVRIFWDWLVRARAQGVIRRVNLPQTVHNVIGLLLYYPAVAEENEAIAGPEPFSPRARQIRKEELRHMLRGLLEPR